MQLHHDIVYGKPVCNFHTAVRLFDGVGEGAPLIEEFCTFAHPVTSTGSSLVITFETGRSGNEGGFSLNWKFVSKGWLE